MNTRPRTDDRLRGNWHGEEVTVTDEEHEMVRAISDRVDEIHDTLFGVPKGSTKDTRPLITDMRDAVRVIKQASWSFRALVWIITGLAAIGGAVQVIVGWFRGGA